MRSRYILIAFLGIIGLGLSAFGLQGFTGSPQNFSQSSEAPNSHKGQSEEAETSGYFEKLLAQFLSTSDHKISIGKIEGALSSNVTLYNVTISDPQGSWLQVDQVQLVWNRWALLSRRLEIQKLAIQKITFSRPFLDNSTETWREKLTFKNLPLKVDIQDFSLKEFVLSQEVAGKSGRFQASGALNLGPPQEGLMLRLKADRLDGLGKMHVHFLFVPESDTMALDAQLQEEEGGFVTYFLDFPGNPSLDFKLKGKGKSHAFTTDMDLHIGQESQVAGQVKVQEDPNNYSINLEVQGQKVENFLPKSILYFLPLGKGEEKSIKSRLLFSKAEQNWTLSYLDIVLDRSFVHMEGKIEATHKILLNFVGKIDEVNSGFFAHFVPIKMEAEGFGFSGKLEGPWQAPRGTFSLQMQGLDIEDWPRQDFKADVSLEPVYSRGNKKVKSLRPPRLRQKGWAVKLVGKGDKRLNHDSLPVHPRDEEKRKREAQVESDFAWLAQGLGKSFNLDLNLLTLGNEYHLKNLSFSAAHLQAKIHGKIQSKIQEKIQGKSQKTASGNYLLDLYVEAQHELPLPALQTQRPLRDNPGRLQLRGHIFGPWPRAQGTADLFLKSSLGEGHLALKGEIGEEVDLRVKAHQIPLEVATQWFSSQSDPLALQGILEGEGKISGPLKRLEFLYTLKVRDLSTAQLSAEQFGGAHGIIKGTGDFNGTQLNARLEVPSLVTLVVQGAVPFSSVSPMNLSAQGTMKLQGLKPFLPDPSWQIDGTLTLDSKISGTFSDPKVQGKGQLTQGRLMNLEEGLRLEKLSAHFLFKEDQVHIEQGTARAGKKGTLIWGGKLDLQREKDFPISLYAKGENVDLLSNPIVQASGNLNLEWKGTLTGDSLLKGRVGFSSMIIQIPRKISHTLPAPLSSVSHHHPPPHVLAHLHDKMVRASTLSTKYKKQNGKGRIHFDVRLGGKDSGPAQVYVRGHGLNAHMAGEMRISGTSEAPDVKGGFNFQKGSLSIFSKHLNLTEGQMQFTGSTVPDLTLSAQINTGGIQARIHVGGRASEPRFTLTSQPPLPKDEIVSRILFAKAAGDLTPLQILFLAKSLLDFQGGVGGLLENLRDGLGADRLEVESDGKAPSLGLSRTLSDRVTLGIKAGATTAQTGASVDINVAPHMRLQGEVLTNGSVAAGVGAEWEF